MAEEKKETAHEVELRTVRAMVNEYKADLKESTKEIWTELKELRNRLPLWATFLFMAMTGTITTLITMLTLMYGG